MRGVLSLVERGWHAAREESLHLAGKGISVEHLIKGKLGAVKACIARHQLIRLVDVRRWLFPFAMGWRVLLGALTRRIRWVMCDNERTLKRIEPWCRRLGLRPVWIREKDAGYEIMVEGKATAPEEAFKA